MKDLTYVVMTWRKQSTDFIASDVNRNEDGGKARSYLTGKLGSTAMKCSLALLVLLFFIASTGWSKTSIFPIEESFDGPIDDDDPVTWFGIDLMNSEFYPPAPGAVVPLSQVVVDGALQLSNTAQLDPRPQGFSLGLNRATIDGESVMVGDASARAVFSVSDELTFGSIYTRGQDDTGDGGAYFGNIRGNGLITVGSFTGLTKTLETALNPVEDKIVFQLDTIGNSVTASAWNVDEPDIVFSDTFIDETGTRPPGFFGLGLGKGGPDPTGAMVTFDSYEMGTGLPPGILDNPGLNGRIPPGLKNGLPSSSHHSVPEPSSVLLLLGCSIGLVTWQRRRPNVR